MKVFTDGADYRGRYEEEMRAFDFSADLPETVTVPAHGEVTLTASVTLDKEELDDNMEVFSNGFFIDGYVFLASDDEEIPMLNIPFTGFYGDWCAQRTLDGYYFDKDSLLGGSYLFTVSYRMPNGLFSSEATEYKLGDNLFEVMDYYYRISDKRYAGISPNFDGESDDLCAYFAPLRMTGKTDYAICDINGNDLIRRTDTVDGNDYYTPKYVQSYLGFSQEELTDLPDGDYVFKIYSGYRYRKPYLQNETLSMPFYIDREAPKITEFSIDEDKQELTFSVSDNRYLMGISITAIKDGEIQCKSFSVLPQQTYSNTISIAGLDLDSLIFEVLDFAYNSTQIGNALPEFSYEGRQGTEFIFNAYSSSGQDIPCNLLLGLYRQGRLVAITQKSETIKNGVSHKVFDLDCDVYDTVRLFAWERDGSLKPVCENFEF